MISEPRNGVCWVRNGTVLHKVSLEKGMTLRQVSTPEAFELRDIIYTSREQFYIVGNRGGYRWTGDEWTACFGQQPIYSISELEDGELIVALASRLEFWQEDVKTRIWKGEISGNLHPFTFGEYTKGTIWAAAADYEIYRYFPESSPPETRITSAPSRLVLNTVGVFGVAGYDAWNHTDSSKLEYSWRIVEAIPEGDIDVQWSPFRPERTFTAGGSLSAGRYALEVRAQDLDFNVDPVPARVEFTVVPPLWLRAGFVIPVSLLGLLSFSLTGKLYSSHARLRKNRDQLDLLVQSKTKDLL